MERHHFLLMSAESTVWETCFSICVILNVAFWRSRIKRVLPFVRTHYRGYFKCSPRSVREKTNFPVVFLLHIVGTGKRMDMSSNHHPFLKHNHTLRPHMILLAGCQQIIYEEYFASEEAEYIKEFSQNRNDVPTISVLFEEKFVGRCVLTKLLRRLRSKIWIASMEQTGLIVLTFSRNVRQSTKTVEHLLLSFPPMTLAFKQFMASRS